MFPCPQCGTYLNEPELIKRNIKYMGAIEIEYDARCPRCSEMIGHVSWGQFTPLPSSDSAAGDTPPPEPSEPEEKRTPLIPPPKEIRPIVSRGKPAIVKKKTQADAPKEVRICPHCGQPWLEKEPD